MTLAPRLLVVDDEAAIRLLLRRALERAGYAVTEAADARAALVARDIDKPDLVLLDLGLPDRDGLELLPLLLRAPAPSVIVVSARETTADKVAALDLGADDFIEKPFDADELLARCRGALRRRARGAAPDSVVRAGAVTIDLARRLVQRDGARIHVTPKEWGVLAELARHPGRVLTHAALLRAVWGPAHERDVEYLRVAVRSLRQKLEAEPSQPTLIANEIGVGYRLLSADSGL